MIVVKYIIGIISGLLVGIIIGISGVIIGKMLHTSGLIIVCIMTLVALKVINRKAELYYIKERRNIK